MSDSGDDIHPPQAPWVRKRTAPCEPTPRTHWAVRMNKGRRRVHVHADYHVIEQGCLKFRNVRRNQYPENVLAFAHGEWVSVENLSVPTEE